ncbi:cytochrome c [Chitinophaga pendula]|uniref:c-type cytochrome n=1 Tax=Chitinophaga TaxID=79328 RepID=UPI000BAE6B69|nr:MULTISPECIES: cytochrome C [Chitinophaga]ASZ13781.1 cytochrome C [Chitinophaga sp. MD30]UCJ08599.1 cytochrome c [Chitinophaga pendula]
MSTTKKVLQVTGSAILVLLLLVTSSLAYIKWLLPDVGPAPRLRIHITPERVKRGQYLANHVTACMDCHSTRDFSRFSAPPVPGTEGSGGQGFGREEGFPGQFFARNITPYALGTWTDGEIFRAITTGVSRDGTALFPLMPYKEYGKMDKEDIYAIIAYLRTLKPIKTYIPRSRTDFPTNVLINLLPEKNQPATKPDTCDQLNYGRYLTNAAGCTFCHTRQEKGYVTGEALAGGFQFSVPSGTLRSSNITPDDETGIGRWSEAIFVQRFKMYQPGKLEYIRQGDYNTIMPWSSYSQMDSADLKAIYTYLSSLKPVKKSISRFSTVSIPPGE